MMVIVHYSMHDNYMQAQNSSPCPSRSRGFGLGVRVPWECWESSEEMDNGLLESESESESDDP